MMTVAVMVVGSLVQLQVKVEAAAREIEINVAADAISNNLDLTGFSDKLKTVLNNQYNISLDKIHINTVDSSSMGTSNFSWYRFDHTNQYAQALRNNTNVVTYYSDPYMMTTFDYHVRTLANSVEFNGYGSPAFKDFVFTPNDNANNKIFTFTLNEAQISYHTAEGAGFIFNAKYTNNSDTDRRLSGYVVLLGQTDIYIYRLDNIEINAFKEETSLTLNSIASTTGASGSAWGGTVYNLATISKQSVSSGSYRYLKLVASPTTVSLYQFTNNTYSTIQYKLFENFTLPMSYNTFGYGMMAAYSSHGCSELTTVKFTDFKLAEDTSISFTDRVRSTSWQYEDSLRLFVNVDNDGIADFSSANNLSSVLFYMIANKAHYVGWGLNSSITIGSTATTVKAQADSLITSNYGRGTFINRATSATLDQGISALAAYINGQLTATALLVKPTLSTSFPATNTFNFTTSTTTSLNNPVSNYEWRTLDVPTGVWSTLVNNTNAYSVVYPSGYYKFVSIRVQDSVTQQWSDYSEAYIATDANATSVATFTLDKTQLMPDTTVDSLKTGTVITAYDNSYHPSGAALSNWEWKVYNASLVEQTDMALTYTTIPQSISFNFDSKPAGIYSIQLRVKKGTTEWSTAYKQNVTVFKESSTISITPSEIIAASGKGYTGTETIGFTVASTNSTISGYRLIKVPTSTGTNLISDWVNASAASVTGSGSVSGGSYDVYVQAKDTLGNSKTQLIGRYLSSHTVTFKDFDGSVIKTLSVIEGSMVQAKDVPSDPSRTAYTFKSWSNLSFTDPILEDTRVSAQYDIIVVDITITADPQTKSYGASDPSNLTYTITSGSLFEGIGLSGKLTRTTGENVGKYSLLQNNLTLANNPHYNITFVSADLTINPASLVLTPQDKTKVYGAAEPTMSFSATGLKFSDTVEVVQNEVYTTMTGAQATVGTHAITLTEATADNYTISYAPKAATLTVTPANLVLKPSSLSKVYGDSDPVLSYTALGFQYDDDKKVIDESNLEYSVKTDSAAVVGEHKIYMDGASADNYQISYQVGTLTVTKAPLTLKVDNKTKVYGASEPSLSFSIVSGIKYEDTKSVVTGGTYQTTSGSSAVVGDYAITFTGASASNYELTVQDGTLSVTPANLTLTPVNKTKVYGTLDPVMAYTISGLKYEDTSSVLNDDSVKYEFPKDALAIVGTHTISMSDVETNSNYTLTYATGKLTVTPAELILKPSDLAKVYGEKDPTPTFIGLGYKYSDDNQVIDTANLVYTLHTGSAATVGNHTISMSGATASNYSITTQEGTLSVSKAPLTLKVDNKTKVYGASEPSLSFSIVSGLVYEDTKSVVTEGTYKTTTGSDAVVGNYTISLSGSTADNYELTIQDGTLTVTKAPLLLQAQDKAKVYGDDEPAMSFVATGLQYEDSLDVVLNEVFTCVNGAQATAGTHSITLSEASADNYEITYGEPAVLTVSPKALTIATVTVKNKIFDGTTLASLTDVSLSQSAYGDVLTVRNAATGTFETSVVGVDIPVSVNFALDGEKADNYTLVIPMDLKARIYTLREVFSDLAEGKTDGYNLEEKSLTDVTEEQLFDYFKEINEKPETRPAQFTSDSEEYTAIFAHLPVERQETIAKIVDDALAKGNAELSLKLYNSLSDEQRSALPQATINTLMEVLATQGEVTVILDVYSGLTTQQKVSLPQEIVNHVVDASIKLGDKTKVIIIYTGLTSQQQGLIPLPSINKVVDTAISTGKIDTVAEVYGKLTNAQKDGLSQVNLEALLKIALDNSKADLSAELYFRFTPEQKAKLPQELINRFVEMMINSGKETVFVDMYHSLSSQQRSQLPAESGMTLLKYVTNSLLKYNAVDPLSNVSLVGFESFVNLNDEVNPNVDSITLKINGTILETTQQPTVTGLETDKYALVHVYDLKIIKTTYLKDGSFTSEILSMDQVQGEITVRLPVPEAFSSKTDLGVIYIAADGTSTTMASTLVTIDGVRYLEFKTTHFSYYAIVEAKSPFSLWSMFSIGFGVITSLSTAYYLFLALKRRSKKESAA